MGWCWNADDLLRSCDGRWWKVYMIIQQEICLHTDKKYGICYINIIFLQNTCNIHPIAHLWGWDMGVSIVSWNRTLTQIPQCTSPISHNAPFCNRNVHMCAHFCYKTVHCGIFVWCIVGFVRCLFRGIFNLCSGSFIVLNQIWCILHQVLVGLNCTNWLFGASVTIDASAVKLCVICYKPSKLPEIKKRSGGNMLHDCRWSKTTQKFNCYYLDIKSEHLPFE